jgi:hypothetical protein
VRLFHHNNRAIIDQKSRKIKIFAKKTKKMVWCDDPPEDRVISIFAGCLANHDRAHSQIEQDSTSNVVMLVVIGTFIPGTADGAVTEVRHSR